MNSIFGSHFVYTKHERNGILLLVLIIVFLQFIIQNIEFGTEDVLDLNSAEIISIQNQIDSLKQNAREKRKPKIYPFNPNFISDYKGYQLGMSISEIDRLHSFRAKNRYVNSPEEFQEVTEISDSLLKILSPNFKFPKWVRKREKSKRKRTRMTFDYNTPKEKSLISTTDINLATLTDFLAVDGVDDDLSERIIKYRTTLKGFMFSDQIYEVWGLDSITGSNILQTFSIQSLPEIRKININTASFKEVLSIPYIDYELCVKIFDFRDEVAELQSIEELKIIEGFPTDKYDRIVVYLHSQ